MRYFVTASTEEARKRLPEMMIAQGLTGRQTEALLRSLRSVAATVHVFQYEPGLRNFYATYGPVVGFHKCFKEYEPVGVYNFDPQPKTRKPRDTGRDWEHIWMLLHVRSGALKDAAARLKRAPTWENKMEYACAVLEYVAAMKDKDGKDYTPPAVVVGEKIWPVLGKSGQPEVHFTREYVEALCKLREKNL